MKSLLFEQHDILYRLLSRLISQKNLTKFIHVHMNVCRGGVGDCIRFTEVSLFVSSPLVSVVLNCKGKGTNQYLKHVITFVDFFYFYIILFSILDKLIGYLKMFLKQKEKRHGFTFGTVSYITIFLPSDIRLSLIDWCITENFIFIT